MTKKFLFRVRIIVVLLTTMLLGACVNNRINLEKTGKIQVKNTSSKSARLSSPNVWAEDNQLVVSGYVARTHQASGMLFGHVHVSVVNDDKEIDNLTAEWIPWSLPIRSPYQSHYTIRRATLPPEGSVVHVYVCFKNHPSTNEEPASQGS